VRDRERLVNDPIVADVLSCRPRGASFGRRAPSEEVRQVGLDHGVSLNRLSTGPLAPQDTRVIEAVAR
jgi:hypothetical protein